MVTESSKLEIDVSDLVHFPNLHFNLIQTIEDIQQLLMAGIISLGLFIFHLGYHFL